MRIHLRINYGCDRRYHILNHTVMVCQPHFDTIRVVTACSDEDHEEAKQLERHGPNVKVEKFGTPWYGDMEPLFRNLMWDVPEGEWIHFLDSDERPTYDFIQSMQQMIEESESSGVNVIRVPTAGHPPSGVNDFSWLGYRNVYEGKVSYAEPSFFKFNRRNNHFISTYGGGHSMPHRTDHSEKMYLKPTLHFKNWDNWLQAVPLQGFFSPTFHANAAQYPVLIKTKEHEDFQKVKEELGCFTSTQFMYEATHKTPKMERFREVFLTFKGSAFHQFEMMYKWADQGMPIHVGEVPVYCGRPCCKYRDIQL